MLVACYRPFRTALMLLVSPQPETPSSPHWSFTPSHPLMLSCSLSRYIGCQSPCVTFCGWLSQLLFECVSPGWISSVIYLVMRLCPLKLCCFYCTGRHTESAASSTQQFLLDKAEEVLQDQQTQLVAKLLADRALQEVTPLPNFTLR